MRAKSGAKILPEGTPAWYTRPQKRPTPEGGHFQSGVFKSLFDEWSEKNYAVSEPWQGCTLATELHPRRPKFVAQKAKVVKLNKNLANLL